MINEHHRNLLTDPRGHNMNVMAERLNHIINKINVNNIRVLLDIGSMDAFESINLARVFEDAEVHAFEPVRHNYNMCELNIADNRWVSDRIHLHRLALNDVTGPLTFYELDITEAGKRGKINSGMGSKYQLMDPDMWPWEHNVMVPVTVPGYTITDWCLENKIDRVDGIWMDVQGAELDVIKGISPALLQNIQFIITEAGLKPYYHGQNLKTGMDEYLEKNGFVEWLPAYQVAHEYEANVIYLNTRICKF